jgi:hypothetical protein
MSATLRGAAGRRLNRSITLSIIDEISGVDAKIRGIHGAMSTGPGNGS